MASEVPSKMKAIVIDENTASVKEVSLPKIRPTYLLAKVEAIALNPTDWKHIAFKLAPSGAISGCDFAGTVVEVGSEVTKDIKPGDRIAATTHGGSNVHPEDGCFGEYTLAKADLVVKLPDSLSFEKAATFPLGASTVAQGMFQKALKMQFPTEGDGKGEDVLLYGGSTATGSLGIQYGKIAGYNVLTTCSPKNNEFVKALGASAAYDYNDPDCGKKINKDTNDKLKLAWDCIGPDSGPQICAAALSSDPKGARYGSIAGLKFPRKDGVETTNTMMYTIFNEAFRKFGTDFPKSQEDFEFARKFFNMTEKLLHDGKLKTHPEEVRADGLEGALQGMKDMKDGKISAVKLVYRVAETPKGSEASAKL